MVDDTLDHKLIIPDPPAEEADADKKTDLTPDIISDITNNHANGHALSEDHVQDQGAKAVEGDMLPDNLETPPQEQQQQQQEQQQTSINNELAIETPEKDEATPVLTSEMNTDISNTPSEPITAKIDTSEQTSSDIIVDIGSQASGITLSTDTLNTSTATDIESVNADSPSVKKKKTKPMSASMQRLTAKKESPDKRGTDLLSAAERKAKADELRKKKIEDQRAKDEERRAAVLERRKKMEAAEREKKEALFQRLTTKDPKDRPSPMKGRHSLSTSNLTQLRKNRAADTTTTAPKPAESTRPRTSLAGDRPRSSMQRPSMGYPDKTKSFNGADRKREEVKRPQTAFGTRSTTSQSKTSRSSQQPANPPPRPQTSMGLSAGTEKKKQLSSRELNASSERLSTTRKPLSKAKSTSNVSMSTTRPASVAGSRPSTGTKPKPPRAATPLASSEKKEAGVNKTGSPRKEKPTAKPKDLPPAKKELTKEEAKKALAERRKKAKEEAEEKAREEREKDEAERLKREEDERRLAEQLRLEEERQAKLLEQVKREEEERRIKMTEEKEQREREEKERLEEEARLREEEIERKAKLEMEKIQKEQDRQEELLEQERMERKKRVEMIMARVSSKGMASEEQPETSSPVSLTPTDTPPVTATPPPELVTSTDSARMKVDDILRSRGFGKSMEDISRRSMEDISKVLDRSEENVAPTSAVTTGDVAGEAEPNEATPVAVPADDENKTEIVDTIESAAPSETISNLRVSNDNIVPSEENQSAPAPEQAPSSVDEVSTNGDNCAAPDELTETLEELTISTEGGETSLNDTNNNKDFHADDAISAPLNAWNENTSTAPPEGVLKLPGEEEQSAINESNDLNANGGGCDATSSPLEKSEWNNFEERMKQLPAASAETVPAGEEKLWKVLEGKVEMSECY